MSCCNLAIKLHHFRQTRNERRAVFNRTNPNFDSWLKIFPCSSLLSNISLDALIVLWMRRFTSHNLQKLFTAIFTPVFHSKVLFLPHSFVYSGSSVVVTPAHYMIGLRVHQYFKLQTKALPCYPPPPQEKVNACQSCPSRQTLSTKCEVVEFGITRLVQFFNTTFPSH